MKTYGEWAALDHPMRWSGPFVDYSEVERFFEDNPSDPAPEELWNRQPFQLNVPEGVADGTYVVRYDGVSWKDISPVRGRAQGVVVKNGKFDPIPTADAIFKAYLMAHGLPEDTSSIHHQFIEGLQYMPHPDGPFFIALLGS